MPKSRASSTEPPASEAARLRSSADELVERLREAISEAAHRERVSHRELARRTGRAPDYWTKVFNGQRELHAAHVFQALLALDAAPGDFLAEVFPPESGTLNAGSDLMAALVGLGKAFRQGRSLEELVGRFGPGVERGEAMGQGFGNLGNR